MPDVVFEEIPQVLAEIQAGDGLSLSAAGRLFPGHRANDTIDPSTVFRWLTKGLRTGDERPVKLEAVRVGARWITSRGAIARFVAHLTAASDRSPAPLPSPSDPRPKRRRASEMAAAALKKIGA